MSTPKPVESNDSSVAPQVSLTGVVERITFHSEESGYTVARLQAPRVRNWIDRFTQSQKITLSPEQQQVVEMAATQRVMILTGGP